MTQNDPMSVLQIYGLDQVLTAQDDPRLWAAVLREHWPLPDDPKLRDQPIDDSPRFSFGVGRLPSESDERSDWSGMIIDERWVLERVDAKHFRANRGEPKYPHFILDMSRPSVSTNLAWVHAGDNPAPLIGYGETRVWVRQEDGGWSETDEVVSTWIS
jgi:hypothetical protein